MINVKKEVCEIEENKNIVGILFSITSIIIFIITFINWWYENQIFEEIFIFAFFLDLFVTLLNVLFLVFSLIICKINKSKWILISIIIILFSLLFKLVFAI